MTSNESGLAVVSTVGALRARLAQPRARGESIGFVPTMGALHAGHAALIERARRDCRRVVVSVFVNPIQFDRPDDLDRYPRTLDADVALCASYGVDAVFAPAVEEMYPAPPACAVDPGVVAETCCGRYRPGHFRGVATVVLKLLNIVQAHRAYFGEKDAQQLAVVRALVADFNVPVEIVGVPTVRESDGLALSSRNRNLTAEERRQAPSLYRGLQAGAALVEAGGRDAAGIVRQVAAVVAETPGPRLEYVEVVDPATFQPVREVTGPVVIAAAMWVGMTRLIDNVECTPRG